MPDTRRTKRQELALIFCRSRTEPPMSPGDHGTLGTDRHGAAAPATKCTPLSAKQGYVLIGLKTPDRQLTQNLSADVTVTLTNQTKTQLSVRDPQTLTASLLAPSRARPA